MLSIDTGSSITAPQPKDAALQGFFTKKRLRTSFSPDLDVSLSLQGKRVFSIRSQAQRRRSSRRHLDGPSLATISPADFHAKFHILQKTKEDVPRRRVSVTHNHAR